MKKIFVLIFSCILCFSSVACSCKNDKINPITLSQEQYVEGEGYIEFLNSYDILNEKFDNKENFAFFMFGAACSGCHKFTPILQEYLKESKIKMYAIEVNTISKANPELTELLGATPAIAVIKEGQLYATIDGYGKEDAQYFETKEGFKGWFETYVVVTK